MAMATTFAAIDWCALVEPRAQHSTELEQPFHLELGLAPLCSYRLLTSASSYIWLASLACTLNWPAFPSWFGQMSFSNEAVLPNSDIVKQGYLYIKRPPRHGIQRFKTWHKRYFVLRDESIDHHRRLEMYLKEVDFTKGGVTKFVLDLENVVHVGRTADSKRFKQVFTIVCLGRSPVLLADEDSLSLNSWLLAVSLVAEKGHGMSTPNGIMTNGGNRGVARRRSCELPDCLEGVPLDRYYSQMRLEDSTAERYEVTIHPTEASNRNDLRGDYHLIVHSWGLSLMKPGREDYVVHWPLCFIRNYKNEMLGLSPKRKTTVVTLELGRRCATGEGSFKFLTQHGKEIMTEINQVITASLSRKVASELTRQQYLSGSSQGSSLKGPWEAESSTAKGLLSPTADWLLNDSSFPHRKIHRSESEGNRASILSITSSASTSSGESAEYIMAAFSEQTKALQFDTASSSSRSLRTTRSSNDIANYLPLTIEGNVSKSEAQRQRVERAEAEGYLEVLPDYFDGEKLSEERKNIYHNMDFSNSEKTGSDNSKSSDTGDSCKSSSKSESLFHRRKPPAPLPRPDHTIPEFCSISLRRMMLTSPSDKSAPIHCFSRRSDPYPQTISKSESGTLHQPRQPLTPTVSKPNPLSSVINGKKSTDNCLPPSLTLSELSVKTASEGSSQLVEDTSSGSQKPISKELSRLGDRESGEAVATRHHVEAGKA